MSSAMNTVTGTKLTEGQTYDYSFYVKNKETEFGDEPHHVSGMLLYAATDEAIQPDNVYQMSGNTISCSGRVKRATPEPGGKGQIQPIRKGQNSR